ncbi:hypothetical protein H5410_045340 [Solanum commersonii]|uniref:Uncharacterized protein n=1 Tax=Solanum commersonii TaxID=4109 RepID=A0A9J5XAU9_SOLCO|nr:hypothetical protein H5410_045340 [Solanum commersonii]
MNLNGGLRLRFEASFEAVGIMRLMKILHKNLRLALEAVVQQRYLHKDKVNGPEVMQRFMNLLRDPNSYIAANREGINWDLSDKLKWGYQKGVYTIKEGYQQLCSRNPVIANRPWKLIWRTKLPPKIHSISRDATPTLSFERKL